ncbi:MAG: GNAT family N-acetyltransferase [Rhodococcus sp. (in: high G+C Gram-positive bacteria)]
MHFWFARDGRAVSTLRVLRDDGRARIGRVCTAVDARGLGLSARLMTAAIEVIGNEPIVIGAQAYLEKWYAGFGFERSGPNYAEDGIPHLPMIKPAG